MYRNKTAIATAIDTEIYFNINDLQTYPSKFKNQSTGYFNCYYSQFYTYV